MSAIPPPPRPHPPEENHAQARPARGAVASPSKSRIPSSPSKTRPAPSNSHASDSSILSTMQHQDATTPMNAKRRIPSAFTSGAEGCAHPTGVTHHGHPRPIDSPEPAQDDQLTPANEWLGVHQPEPSSSPRCTSSSQRSRGNGAGVNRTSTCRAANSARASGGRIAFGSGSMKASSLSPPGPAKPQRGQQQEQGEQAHGQQQTRPPSRGRETRGSILRRSAVEERIRGIHSKQSGTFGSRPLNTSSTFNRSLSNTRERPSTATVNPPSAGAAGARVRPLSAPRIARSPSVARRPSSATAPTAANAAACSNARSSSSIAASMRQSGSGSVVRQIANENPAHRSTASPARHGESNIGAGIAAATAAKAGYAAGAGGAAHGGSHQASILSSIPEKPAIHYPVKGAQGPKHPGVKPSFSLDLSSLKKEGSPSPLSAEKSATTPGSSGSKPSVPKLNLTPLLKEQEEHAQSVKEAYAEASAEADDVPTAHEGGKLSNSKQGSAASHKKGGHSGGSGAAQKKAPPPEPPQDHFYFYPKMDPNDERKTMEAISRMPKPMQRHMRKIYDEMVEAKQNCEAIAFRGHRLLDQLQTHHKEKMEMREQEMARELQAYQAQAEETRRELERIRAVLLARSNGEAVGELGSLRGLHNHAGKWLFSDTPMAEISDGPDQAAYLVAQQEAVDAMLQQVQGDIASSRNEMSKLHASSQLQHMLHGPPTSASSSSATTTAPALTPQQVQPSAAAAPSGGPVHVPKLNLGLASSPAPKSNPPAAAAAAAAAPSAASTAAPHTAAGAAGGVPKLNLNGLSHKEPARPVELQVPKLNLGAMARIDAPTPSAHPPPHNPDMDAALSPLQQQQQQQGTSSCAHTPAPMGGGPAAPAIPKLDLKGALGHAAPAAHMAPHVSSTGPHTAEGGGAAAPWPSTDSVRKLDMGSAAAAAAAAAAAVAAARAEREARGGGAKGGGGSKAGAQGERDDVVSRGGQDQAAGHCLASDVAKQQDKPGEEDVAGAGAGADDCRAGGDQRRQQAALV